MEEDRTRVLPQWLVDVGKGKNRDGTKINGVKNRDNKKLKSEAESEKKRCVSDDVKIDNEKQEPTVSSEKVDSTSTSSPKTGQRRAEKMSLKRPKMSDSEEEEDVSSTVCAQGEMVNSTSDSEKGKHRAQKTPPKRYKISDDEGEGDVNSTVSALVDDKSEIDPMKDENNEDTSEIDKPDVNDNTVSDAGDNLDSSSSNNPADNSSTTTRPICKYGAGCYRKNPHHRQEYSHPEDSDYSTVDNRPECEYGLSCYRKNPLHKQHYKHTKKVTKPRQAKRKNKKNASDDDDADEDEYDLDDPFLNDGSSDDYQPSDSSSDTDFSGAEGNDGSDDAKEPERISKRLQEKKKH